MMTLKERVMHGEHIYIDSFKKDNGFGRLLNVPVNIFFSNDKTDHRDTSISV